MSEPHPIFDARLDEMEIAVFDLETTGLRSHSERIIQVAVVHVTANTIDGEWETFVNPGEDFLPLKPKITELTGIETDDLTGAPDEAQMMAGLSSFVGDRIIAGHNIKFFDIPFVVRAERRTGIDVQTQYYIDTIKLMRRLHPDLGAHTLAASADHYGLPFSAADLHNAMVDTRLTAQVMLKQIEDLSARGVTTFSEMITFLS